MNCSFVSQQSPCSSVGSSTILHINACKQDVTAHLLGLGVSAKRGWRSENPGKSSFLKILKIQLILNRAGYFDLPEDRVASLTICPKHRRELITDWRGRKNASCCYPLHEGQSKQMKEPRCVNFILSKEIFVLHNSAVPVGSGEFHSIF